MPERFAFGVTQRLAGEFSLRGSDRRGGSREAQSEYTVMPRRRRNRQGPATSLVEPRERRRFVERETTAFLGDRQRQHLQRNLEHHAERPQAAGHQPRHVVASDILHHRVSGAIAELVDQLWDISHQFGQEVIELRASLSERIDLQSSISAASQIRQWAAAWRQGYAARLAPLVDQIQGAAVHLPEPLLERILHQSLPNGLGELGRVLSRLEALQPEDLETS